ncbi:MAG: hypothetical protein MK101_02840 [Phycisphaerales bacterium]|nr:hypothetical protein [Phycisphaerales bacterium]
MTTVNSEFVTCCLAVCSMGVVSSSALAADDLLLWVEGNPPVWSQVEHWVIGGGDAHVPTGEIVFRLIDPEAAGGAGEPWDLSNGMQTQIIACIKSLRDGGFTGDIHVVPYFGDGAWNWVPAAGAVTQPWEAPFQWVIEANSLLAGNAVAAGIKSVTLESENSSGIVLVNDNQLLQMQQYQQSIWPTLSQDPAFVAMSATRAWTAAAIAIRWTTTTDGLGDAPGYYQEPPMCRVALQCYNMTKVCDITGGDSVTFNDAYAAGASITDPVPAAPDTIYTLAAVATDPVTTILDPPDVACPSSATPAGFGFLVGNKTPPGDMEGKDLSGVTFMFSIESVSAERGIIDAFGTWDGTGGRAGVSEFASFIDMFEASFMNWWNPSGHPPQSHYPGFGMFPDLSVRVPDSWWANGNGGPCGADLSGDGVIDVQDLDLVLADWGTAEGDVTGDGITTILDVLEVLMAWGACP